MSEAIKKDILMDSAVAEKEFLRFVEAWDIEADTERMSKENKDSFEQQKDRLVRQIEKGNLTVDANGRLAYKLQYPSGAVTEVAFLVPKGSAYMSMDRHKENESMHKLFAFMADSTGQAPQFFANMDGRDMKVCMGVALLFLGS